MPTPANDILNMRSKWTLRRIVCGGKRVLRTIVINPTLRHSRSHWPDWFPPTAQNCNAAAYNVLKVALIDPPVDLNPVERARTKLKLAPGFLVRSAPKPRRVVDRVGT